MEKVKLQSSELDWVIYHEEHEILEAKFKKGERYIYYEIPLYLYQSLLSAESHGKFFNSMIRNAGYDYKKVK